MAEREISGDVLEYLDVPVGHYTTSGYGILVSYAAPVIKYL